MTEPDQNGPDTSGFEAIDFFRDSDFIADPYPIWEELREKCPVATAHTCRSPESLERTNHDAPSPMWQSTHGTRAWGERS